MDSVAQWDDLAFWRSEDWDNIQRKIDYLEAQQKVLNPERENLFAALDETPFDTVRVMFIGQDPYPENKYATGIAYSIPASSKTFPSTLINIFKEYKDDLHYDVPTSGDLTKWCAQGVLLWNAYPSCENGKSLSHLNWIEWQALTREIIEELSKRPTIFVFMGAVAREFAQYVDLTICDILETAHPVPRASLKSKTPFNGSRIFTSVNDLLIHTGREPIDWQL